MEIIDHIKYIIEKIRPFMISDGGDVEFVKYEDGIVYITISGACALADGEITDTVETILTSEIPEVIGVEVIKENTNNS